MEQVAEAVWVEVEKKWAEQQAKTHAALIQVEQAVSVRAHPGPCTLCIKGRRQAKCKAKPSARKSTACIPCQHTCKKCSWTTWDLVEVLLEGRVREWTSWRRAQTEVMLPQGTSACKKARRPADGDEDDKDNEEVEELVPCPLEEVAASHVDVLGMLTESLNLLIMKMAESNAQREWVERQRLEIERERLEIDQRRLELDEAEKKWRALAWEVEMEEKKPGLLTKNRVEFMDFA